MINALKKKQSSRLASHGSSILNCVVIEVLSEKGTFDQKFKVRGELCEVLEENNFGKGK